MPAAESAAARELRERRRNVLLLYVLSTLSTTSNGSMTFVLPLNLVAALDTLARIKDTNRTALCCDAVRQYLENSLADASLLLRVAGRNPTSGD